MEFTGKKIILASKSPRRSQLLAHAGIPFEVKVEEVEETYPPDMPVDEVAPFLAHKKANAALKFLEPNSIILASDSVVILDEVIYGKPEGYEGAFQMLRTLSGRVHRVITGVCLLSEDKVRVFSETAYVHFDPLSDEEIDYYIRHYEPYDKAGAYAIQEWVGLCKISRIEGTYSNIMGLPMNAVCRELEAF